MKSSTCLLLFYPLISLVSSHTHLHGNANTKDVIFNHLSINPNNFEDSLFEDPGDLGPLGSSSGSGSGSSPSACLPNYKLSEGSIIKTKESLESGARFINESDLGVHSKEECLRLCCRTPYCNVAVFQEKSSGSCYLFDCGPSEDFRCRFTSQIAYISAILRRKELLPPVVVPVPPSSSSNNKEHGIKSTHAEEGSSNQHEVELTKLRNRGEVVDKGHSVIGVSGRSGGESATSSPPSTSSPPVGQLEGGSRRCSRWQFECKSSGECIAIYNVCDGIPNCDDQSDEVSPELHCPSGGIASLPQQQKTIHYPPPPPPQLQSASNKASSSSSETLLHHGGVSHPNVNQESGDRIFSHKDGGLMGMDRNTGGGYSSNNGQQGVFGPGRVINQYMKTGYDYTNGDTLGERLIANGNTNYGSAFGPSYGGNPYPGGGYATTNQGQGAGGLGGGINSLPQFNGGGQQQYPMMPQQQSAPFYNFPKVVVPQQQQQQQPPQQILSNRNNESSPQGVTEVPKSSPPPPLPPSSPLANSSSSKGLLLLHAEVEEARLEDEILANLKKQVVLSDEHSSSLLVEDVSSSQQQHAAGPGAVMLFVIGLSMSIILSLVVGCRLRRTGGNLLLLHGGRGRNNRRKNRLDPDYLVDGMYL